MTYTFKLARRLARFRAIATAAALLVAAACDNANPVGPLDPTDAPIAVDEHADSPTPAGDVAFLTASTAEGIPFGPFGLPDDMYSSSMTGSVRAVGPADILSVLATARKAGAKVVLRLSAGEKYWTNPDHSVNLSKWMSQVGRFKAVNIQSYIADGTFLAHYLIDEPHDPSNWGGKPVLFETLEAMAKYSKQLWPGLTTVVRAHPDWLSKAAFRWTYLDAAWSQYSARKGEVHQWMETQVSYSQKAGLGLIVGLNLLDGGNEASGIAGNKAGSYAMSASQIKDWGSVLATAPQACAMYSWKYTSSYFGRASIAAAMEYVASKAKNRSRQPCRQADALPSINPTVIKLTVTGRVIAGRQHMALDWSGAKGHAVDVYLIGARRLTTENDGHFVYSLLYRGPNTYSFKVCQQGSSVCSKSMSVSFK